MIYLTLGVLLGTIAARRRGTAVDRGAGRLQRPHLGHPLLRGRADGVDLHLAEVEADRGHLLPPDHRRTRWPGRPAWRCPGWCIGLTFSTAYARYSRGQMIETLGEDYVRTAVAKGVCAARRGGPATPCGPRSCRSSRSSASTSPPCWPARSSPSRSSRSTASARWPSTPIFSPADFPVVSATVLFAATVVVLANLHRRPAVRRHRPSGAALMTTPSRRHGVRPTGARDGRALPGRREPLRPVPDARRPGPGRLRSQLHRPQRPDPRHRGGVRIGQVGVVDGGARAAQPAARPGCPARSGSAAPRSSAPTRPRCAPCAATTSR